MSTLGHYTVDAIVLEHTTHTGATGTRGIRGAAALHPDGPPPCWTIRNSA